MSAGEQQGRPQHSVGKKGKKKNITDPKNINIAIVRKIFGKTTNPNKENQGVSVAYLRHDLEGL